MIECGCEHQQSFRGVLRHSAEGTGLSLFCGDCDGWVDDSWLFSDGIPVHVTIQSLPGMDWMTTYYLRSET